MWEKNYFENTYFLLKNADLILIKKNSQIFIFKKWRSGFIIKNMSDFYLEKCRSGFFIKERADFISKNAGKILFKKWIIILKNLKHQKTKKTHLYFTRPIWALQSQLYRNPIGF